MTRAGLWKRLEYNNKVSCTSALYVLVLSLMVKEACSLARCVDLESYCLIYSHQHSTSLQPNFFGCPKISFYTFITVPRHSQPVRMDALVATYSRPAFEDEGYSSDEHQELIQAKPSLSLNFALPPLRNVSYPRGFLYSVPLLKMTLSPQAFSAL